MVGLNSVPVICLKHGLCFVCCETKRGGHCRAAAAQPALLTMLLSRWVRWCSSKRRDVVAGMLVSCSKTHGAWRLVCSCSAERLLVMHSFAYAYAHVQAHSFVHVVGG